MMIVEAAPMLADPAPTRVDAVKGASRRVDAGQGSVDGAADFAGLLSLSVATEDSAVSSPNGTADDDEVAPTAPTVVPMDPVAMLALLDRANLGAPPVAAPVAAPALDADDLKAPEGLKVADDLKAPESLSAVVAGEPATSLPAQWQGRTFGGDEEAAPVLATGAPDGASRPKVGHAPAAVLAKPVPGQSDGLPPEPAAAAKTSALQSRLPWSVLSPSDPAEGLQRQPAGLAGGAIAALLPGGKGDQHGSRPTGTWSDFAPLIVLPVNGLAEGGARAGLGGQDKAADGIGKPSLIGLAPGSGQMPGQVADQPMVLETPTAHVSDAMLADTVSYWVTQGVQNAELTLDGFGGEPIEVSIQLANGEAQIGFRSDLPETREAIEGAIAQLKESLANEGLVLAGVSVGTSSRHDGRPGEGQARGSARTKGIRFTEAPMLQPAPRANGAVGRSIDLFV